MEAEYKRNRQMPHTLRYQDPDSKTERNLQLLPCLWNFAKDSKNSFFHFENNSLELVLSKLVSVLEWNAASLAITSALFRSTFSILHERINLTLVCRLSIRIFVIYCLTLTRNKSGSIQSFPSIRCCIANLFTHILTLSIGRKCLSCCTLF